MTPPVNIKPLEKFFPDKLEYLPPPEQMEAFGILKADAEGENDQKLTLEEVQKFFAKYKIPDPPQGFPQLLREVEHKIKSYFKPLYPPLALLTALKEYNQGLYQAEKRLAEEPATFKTSLNLLFSWEWPHDAYRKWIGQTTLPILDPMMEEEYLMVEKVEKHVKTGKVYVTKEPSHYLFDQAYAARAYKKHHERDGAIHDLERAIRQGLDKKADWVMKGGLQGALGKLDPKTVTLLKDELALEGLWGLASAKDENEYRRKAFEFAKAEREKGNSHERHAFNLSGVRHNLAFTSALLHSLAYDPDRGANSKPLPYEREARELLADISGDGGGFLNVLATAWSPMDYQICRLQQKIKKTSLSDDKVNCELRKVSLRDWSDEEARLAELQLAGVAGSYLFFRGALEGARLGGYVGFRGMYRALKKEHGGRWWQPVKSWRKGREEVIDTLMYSEAEYIGHVGGITRSYLMNFDRFFLALNKQADGGSKWAGFFSRFFSGAKHVVLGSAALGTVIEAAPNSSSRVGQAYNRRLDLSPWPDGKD